MSAAVLYPSDRRDEDAIQPVYDEATGKLQQLNYDSDKNGRVDTVSYMDGARLLRIEIDKNEDGLVERWEHYGPDRTLESVGVSRSGEQGGRPVVCRRRRLDHPPRRIDRV